MFIAQFANVVLEILICMALDLNSVRLSLLSNFALYIEHDLKGARAGDSRIGAVQVPKSVVCLVLRLSPATNVLFQCRVRGQCLLSGSASLCIAKSCSGMSHLLD